MQHSTPDTRKPVNIKRRFALLALQIAVTAGLLFWALSGLDLAVIWQRIIGAEPPYIIAFVLLQFIITWLTAWRWAVILRYLGYATNVSFLNRVMWIATFFKTVMPTTLGFDVSRGYYLRRDAAGWAQVLHSILLDRIVGTASLALLAVPALIVLLEFYPEIERLLWLAGVIAVLGGGGVIYFWRRPLKSRGKPQDEPMTHRTLSFLTSPRAAAGPVALSFLIQALNVGQFLLAALALGGGMNLLILALLSPAILFLSRLPISINGLGVREIAFRDLLAPLGVAAEAAVALALLIFAVNVIISLLGAVVFLLANPRRRLQ